MDTGGPDQRRVKMDPEDEGTNPAQASAGGIGSTIGEIVEDLQGIVRGEVQLAKTELKEDINQMRQAAMMLAAGAFVLLLGGIFLLWAIAYILQTWMPMWAATGIVAIVLLAIGGILAMNGKNKLSEANLKPEQTMESLKEDQEWANQQMKSVKK